MTGEILFIAAVVKLLAELIGFFRALTGRRS